MRVIGTCLTSVLTLSACLGGGGGAGGLGGPAPLSGINLPLATDPADFDTPEYRASGALPRIGAATLYAAGGTGAGVTVGIIDTGIDAGHAEFLGALHPASRDLVRAGSPLADGSGHGTAVAGLLGARKNDAAAHGMAFEASLLVVRADAAGTCPAACLFSQGDLAAATDYAVANGARVLNYSLGDAPSLANGFRRALADAAAADRMLVLAAGNLGAGAPLDPALFALRDEARGRALIVGSVDADNVISGFSNRAGGAASRYLVAPGEALVTTGVGGGSVVASGTSVATPLVSGAAAALLGAAPHLRAEDVVNILLETARDLGAPGPDPIYGRGLLDLDRALAPVGSLSLPTGDSTAGGGRTFSSSSLTLGPAFGRGRDLQLGSALALDSYGRGYSIDLGDRVAGASGAPGGRNGAALAAHVDRQRLTGPETLTLGATTVDVARLAPGSSAAPVADGSDLAGLTTRWQVSERLALRGAIGGAGVTSARPDDALALSASKGIAGLADAAGLALDATLGGSWQASLDLAMGGRGQSPVGADARLAEVALERRLPADARLRFGLGLLDETGGPLGSDGGGALATSGARTQFINVTGTLPLGERVELFGRAELGSTEAAGGGGLMAEFGALRSTAYALGLSAARVFQSTDRLRMTLLQPLRVESGEALLDVPVARDVAGNVKRERREVDLAPQGRELDLELAYGWSQGGARLQAAALLRLEPDHDAGAPPELLLGLGLHLPF